MAKKKDIEIDLTTPKWMGKNIYRYKVINQNGINIYSCVSTQRSMEDVLAYIESLYGNYYLPCKVFCNDKLVKRIGAVSHWRGRGIIDKVDGKRYKSLQEMADDLEVSLSRVKMLLERQMRYEWEKL